MAWDSSRPIPWKRLLRLFGLYLIGVNVFTFVLARQNYGVGTLIATLVGGLAYLGITIAMIKMGWNPFPTREEKAAMAKARAEARAARTGSKPTGKGGATATPGKPKPAPTSRTNANNPRAPRR